jgi:protein-disulfide isomerase
VLQTTSAIRFSHKSQNSKNILLTIKKAPKTSISNNEYVSSTPSIFLPSGELIQGYMSPEEIIQKLKN